MSRRHRSSQGVRLRDLSVEVVLNLTPWRSRAFLGLALAVLGGGLVGALLAASTQAYVRDVALEDQRGFQVVHLGDASQPSAPTMSRASCERLAALEGVRAAGTYQIEGYEALLSLGEVAEAEASPSLLDFDGKVLVVGADLARDAGLPPTGYIQIAGSDSAVATFRVGERLPTGIVLNGSVAVARAPSPDTRSCLVWLRSSVVASDALTLIVGSLDVTGESLIARVSPDSGQAAQRYLTRPDRTVALAIGGLIGLIAGLLRRFRIADVVSYGMSGFSRSRIAVLFLLEDLTGAAAFVAAALGVISVQGHSLLNVANILWAASGAFTLVAAGAVATLAVIVPNPACLARH